ncbi:MAG: T9SS type A sorting domain-containing protein [Chitinophagales bacterium]|nr:T9SS type A sorting domain-containing protein [Chitinophagales bacterium]
MWSSILYVSLPDLPDGLYLVRLKSGEKTVSTKMIVE